MWWWIAGCAFVPADYDASFALDVPLPGAAPDCTYEGADGDFAITQVWNKETLQCVITTTWTGELLDLDGVTAAVDAMAAEYGREPDQVRKVAIQQLLYEVTAATLVGPDGDLGLTLPVVVQGRVDVVPRAPVDASLALLSASTSATDWLAAGIVRNTDVGPERNRNYYEPGDNVVLDELTATYADAAPFTGDVRVELRMSAADLEAMKTIGDLELELQARIAIGATFWIGIP